MNENLEFFKETKNPYVSQSKRSITIRLDEDAIAYFKSASERVGICGGVSKSM